MDGTVIPTRHSYLIVGIPREKGPLILLSSMNSLGPSIEKKADKKDGRSDTR